MLPTLGRGNREADEASENVREGAAATALPDSEAGEDRGGVRRGAGERHAHTQQGHLDAARRRQAPL